MRGRGLLIAAAVLQIVGAGIFVLTAIGLVAMAVYRGGPSATPFLAVGGVGAGVAIGYIVVSIALIRCRRWAWIASLALDGLSALSFLALPVLGHVGLGELLIHVAIVGVPLFVTIGLLIGGRHAVSSTETAAPPPAIQSGG